MPVGADGPSLFRPDRLTGSLAGFGSTCHTSSGRCLRVAVLCMKECSPHGIFPECDAKAGNGYEISNSGWVYILGYAVYCCLKRRFFMYCLFPCHNGVWAV